MNRFVRRSIKTLGGMRRGAITYTKNTYDFARPLVKTISKRITRINFNGLYKDALVGARVLVKRSGKALQVNSVKIVRLSAVSLKRAQRFIIKNVPLAKASVFDFTSTNFIRAGRYITKTYPRLEKFVKANYPDAKKWVATQLPKVEAFLAGQLSARMQRFAA